MISGYRIICFGDEEWEYEGALQRIARDLARTNELIYVTSLGVRTPRPSFQDLKKIAHRVRLWTSFSARKIESARVISPLTFPFYSTMAGVRLSGRIVYEQLARAGVFDSKLPLLLWVGVPTAAPIISRLQGVPYFVHATDCQSAYPGVKREVIARLEEQLASGAAFCATASQQMSLKLKQFNPRTYWIDHSIEYDSFQCPLPSPAEFEGMPRPILGYVGGITSWVDQETLAVLARRFPEASVVLVGKESVSTRALRKYKNIHLLGPKPYEQIPAYIGGFDVCLLPRKSNDWQIFANPLVILEYFAMGKPVVSLDLPFVATHRELFHVYDRNENIAAAVTRALHESEDLAKKRREVAHARKHPSATIELCSYIERLVTNPLCDMVSSSSLES